ncbi:MAG TPA: ATP-binding cassette domain-containing protein [Chitinispirillaceae bacterium]|nr:ATP-binding cassette domain-containing protein [Chitinispirillaceae bacterium]
MSYDKKIPAVEINNLVARYGERTILNNITTKFYTSEIRVILGTSGCGKTTLLKSIIGLLKPYSGSISIFGQKINDQDEPETIKVLKKIGVLFQNGALLGSLTVEENVALPLQMHTTLPEAVIKEIVYLKLSQVDLPHALHLYPGELSGGMRKRVALARALALDPPLLFCDEPSAGLDPVTSAGLDDLLLKLRELLGITVVVVTHELFSIEKIADAITFLHKGSLMYDGPLDRAMEFSEGPVHDFFKRHERNEPQNSTGSLHFNVESFL